MSWQLVTYAILGAVLAVGFGWYERRRPPARVVALVAAMAALAVVGRLAFAPIPNVKPTTDIVLFAGYALGGVPGFAVGAITAVASNVFFGQGPWTAWQMVAWGGVGVGGALLARVTRGRELNRWALAAACAVAGVAFGAFMDIYQWSFLGEQSVGGYAAVSATSLPYNLAHVIGNIVFCLVLGPTFIRALHRYRRRFEVRWERPTPSASAGVAAVLIALTVITAPALAPADARAASPVSKAARYLERVQNRDGGYAGFKGGKSSQLFSGWSALGLAAAGANPQDVTAGKRSIVTYLRRGSLSDTGELERTILVLKGSGLSPLGFKGRNLVSDLSKRRRGDGSWAGNVGFTAFGIMAQHAGGLGTGYVSPSASYLTRAQNGDGGFGYVPRAASDIDDTGAALQALAAAGRRGSATTRKAVAYLRKAQNRDGGFGQSAGRTSNAQSTAWAVQGLVAAGVRPESVGSGPLRYLTRMQRSDGHVRYSATSDQTPVWVTAQALTALAKKPFPLAAAPRERRRSPKAAAVPAVAPGTPSKQVTKKRRQAKTSANPVREPAATTAAAPPTRPSAAGRDALRSDPAASPTGSGDDTPVSAPLLGGAIAAVLVVLWLLRRRLRPRRLAERLSR